MSDVTDIDMNTASISQELTLADVVARLDALGAQVDWLCTNLASLFGFVQQIGSNGGGIRGLMHAMKKAQAPAPELTIVEGETDA